MDIAALVALAGNALVAAAVTDAWVEVRGKVARLFGRGRPDPTIERRLDETHAQLASSAPAELQRAQTAHAARWATRFGDLLADFPDAEAELRGLLAEIQNMAPVTATDHAVAAGGDMTWQADRGGVAAGVIHGNVTVVGAPGSTTRSEDVLPLGYRRLSVVVFYGDKIGTIDNNEAPGTLLWSHFSNGCCVGFGFPQEPDEFMLLDRVSKTWIAKPKTVGELRTQRLALIHVDNAERYANAETVELILASVLRKPAS
jgi:hypothetical protein